MKLLCFPGWEQIATKLDILTWKSMGTGSLLESAPSGHSWSCNLWLRFSTQEIAALL